jgi:hypothetical protein
VFLSLLGKSVPFGQERRLMKRLQFEPSLSCIVDNCLTVFAIIEHKLNGRLDLHKGIVSDPLDGSFDRFVIFTRSSDGAQWKLPHERCFIDSDNPPQTGEKED